jgi:hypothetical protein
MYKELSHVLMISPPKQKRKVKLKAIEITSLVYTTCKSRSLLKPKDFDCKSQDFSTGCSLGNSVSLMKKDGSICHNS